MRTLQPTTRRSSPLRATAIVLVALTLTACTSAAPTPTTAPPKPAPATSVPAASAAPAAPSPSAVLPAGPASVKAVVNSSVATSILADAAGRTLYMFTTDKDRTSACYEACERLWPPLLTQGAPIAGDGATAARVSTTPRRDGSLQVVYGDFPLYYYAADTAPGDAKGQRVGNVWFVLRPTGEPINQQPPAPASSDPYAY